MTQQRTLIERLREPGAACHDVAACFDLMREAAKEIERLQGIVDTITKDAKWCGWKDSSVPANVHLWKLPHCDGRQGATLLEVAEKARAAKHDSTR